MLKTKEGRIVETPMEARQAEPGPKRAAVARRRASVALATIFLQRSLADFFRQVRERDFGAEMRRHRLAVPRLDMSDVNRSSIGTNGVPAH